MCTNYVPTRKERLSAAFGVEFDRDDYVAESWPGYLAPIIRDSDSRRTADLAVFGLIPPWSRDGKNFRHCYNARTETVNDKPSFRQAWRQRQQRDGIVYKQISFDFPIENDDTMVQAFANAITPRTKVLHLTHIINWVGQILPVRKIADMAHARGIEVIADAAHSFGLLDYKIPDLHCDYFGTSLHKFLSAPVGSGMLWIKKEKIGKIWPLVCNDKPQSDDIRKFETLGTRSFCIEQSIGAAIHFHEAIGARRKQERIHTLKHYWASKAMQIPRVKIHTSLNPAYSCAIAGFSMDGLKPGEVDAILWNDHKIHTVGIVWENIGCVRVTPHVYTRLQDLDKLVGAIEKIAKGV
jgi:selenocysteine lyase/cysteine desulfurase